MAIGREVPRGDGAARQESGPAAGNDQHVERSGLLQQFFRRGSLAGDDVRMVEGRHRHHAALPGDARRHGLAILVALVGHDLGAVAARRFQLHLRRVLGHHDQRFYPQQFAREGDRLRMVAGRKCEHAPLALLSRELRQRVVGAAELEGAHALQVFALEEELGADQRVCAGRGEHRRLARGVLDALVRCRYVVVRNHAVITSSPHSCRKWPPFSMTTGSGQPRIQSRSWFITGGPSTGSFAPTAMKLSPLLAVDSESRAWREIAAPGSSGFSGTICGKRRTPALLATFGNGAS